MNITRRVQLTPTHAMVLHHEQPPIYDVLCAGSCIVSLVWKGRCLRRAPRREHDFFTKSLMSPNDSTDTPMTFYGPSAQQPPGAPLKGKSHARRPVLAFQPHHYQHELQRFFANAFCAMYLGYVRPNVFDVFQSVGARSVVRLGLESHNHHPTATAQYGLS